MGIPTIYAALLVRAREDGTTFKKVATIGRQSLTVPVQDLGALAARLGRKDIDPNELSASRFAEPFLKELLGAEQVTSFDYSSYQGVDVVHDFNDPLDPRFRGAFDVLLDGGCIEHIFDVRQVFENYMSMVKPGGSIFIHTPANNLLGHGFYQFSPELFYRVFSAENGFEVRDLCLTESPFSAIEVSRRQRCFLTRDPEAMGKRVRLVNDKPVMLFVHARRLAEQPLFQASPVQSDYSRTWKSHEAAAAEPPKPQGQNGKAAKPFRYLSWWQELRRKSVQRRKHSLANRRFFEALEP